MRKKKKKVQVPQALNPGFFPHFALFKLNFILRIFFCTVEKSYNLNKKKKEPSTTFCGKDRGVKMKKKIKNRRDKKEEKVFCAFQFLQCVNRTFGNIHS
jgi:hypothetical protein